MTSQIETGMASLVDEKLDTKTCWYLSGVYFWRADGNKVHLRLDWSINGQGRRWRIGG